MDLSYRLWAQCREQENQNGLHGMYLNSISWSQIPPIPNAVIIYIDFASNI